MSATPTGQLEHVHTKVRELGEAGALDDDTVTEIRDLLGEITERITALDRILERQLDALTAVSRS